MTHLGYVVDAGGVRVYISGDPVNTFAEHEALLAPIRDLKPDIGLLTNHPSEGEFPFFAGSAKMASALDLKPRCRPIMPALSVATTIPKNGLLGYRASSR